MQLCDDLLRGLYREWTLSCKESIDINGRPSANRFRSGRSARSTLAIISSRPGAVTRLLMVAALISGACGDSADNSLRGGRAPPLVGAKLAGPTTLLVGQMATFDASESTMKYEVFTYNFDFGDGARASGDAPVVTHAFAHAGTFVVNLGVFDVK